MYGVAIMGTLKMAKPWIIIPKKLTTDDGIRVSNASIS